MNPLNIAIVRANLIQQEMISRALTHLDSKTLAWYRRPFARIRLWWITRQGVRRLARGIVAGKVQVAFRMPDLPGEEAPTSQPGQFN